jgi:hypothetical protein
MDRMNGDKVAGSGRRGDTHILDCSGWDTIYLYTGESIYQCCMCGAGLGPDPEDTPHAEGQGRHLCGNCYRSREWDAIEQFEDGS